MQAVQNKMMMAAVTGSMGGGGGPLAALTGGGADPAGGLLSQLGCAPEEVEAEEVVEIDEEVAAIPDDLVAKYTLRLCVHSGLGFARESSFVNVEVAQSEANGGKWVERSPTAPISDSPNFEWMLEKEITIEGSAPDCEIQVMASHMLGDKLLGAAKLQLPDSPTGGPKRQWLKMKIPQPAVSQMLGLPPPEPAKILIVWQLCQNPALEPDLVRIAEMPATAVQRKPYNFGMTINYVQLRKATASPEPFHVQIQLLDANKKPVNRATSDYSKSDIPPKKQKKQGTKALGNASSNAKEFSPPLSSNSTVGEETNKKKAGQPENNIVNFGASQHQGWTPQVPWRVIESQVGLLNYMIKVKLYRGVFNPEKDKVGPPVKQTVAKTAEEKKRDEKEKADKQPTGGPDKWVLEATWMDKIGDIMDTIAEIDQSLIFDGILTEKGGGRTGHVNMKLDVYHTNPHRPNAMEKLTDQAVEKNTTPPKVVSRKGWGAYGDQASKSEVSYYVSCWADGLPTYHDKSDPYMVVKMASSKAETEKKENSFFNVLFKSVIVKAKASERKAVVQIWDQKTWLLGSSWLLGEANIYDVEPDRIFWRHVYGGAFNAPRANVADQMVRGGAIKPSTYHGTIAVSFGVKPRSETDFLSKIEKERTKWRLVVRLYQGLYLPERLRGKGVSVVVQMAGAFLPDVETKAKLAAAKEKQKSSKSEGIRQEKNVLESTGTFNRCLLTFPAQVDQFGVLTFIDKKVEAFGDMGSEKTPSWIQRSTPKDALLKLPPDVRHVYIYIVEDNSEDTPPELYSRLRLHKEDAQLGPQAPKDPAGEEANLLERQKMAEERLSKPFWKRVRWDLSVTEPVQSTFPDDFGGFILGSAYLVQPDSDQVGPAIEDGTRRGRSPVINPDLVGTEDESCTKDRYYMMSEEDLPLLKAPKSDVNQRQVYPRAQMPRSIFCRPCVGQVYRSVGSSGEPSELLAGKPMDKVQAYAHVDVICCRSLKATDADGLCDPTYSIMVDEKVVNHYENSYMEVPKSLNPYYMHRISVPVKVFKVSLTDHDKSVQIPLPPVIFRLQDQDSRLEEMIPEMTGVKNLIGDLDFLGPVFPRIGTVAIKHPNNLDFVDPDKDPPEDDQSNTEGVDLNKRHKPHWHAIDDPAKIPWNPYAAGSDAGWENRPRVLLCAGYSTRKALGSQIEDAHAMKSDWSMTRAISTPLITTSDDADEDVTMSNIATAKQVTLKIQIDLLGLRNVPSSMLHPELKLMSYWKGKPVRLSVDKGDATAGYCNTNFFGDKVDVGAFKDFSSKVKTLVRLKLHDEMKENQEDDPDDGAQPTDLDEDDESSMATSVDVDTLIGVRLGYEHDGPPADGGDGGLFPENISDRIRTFTDFSGILPVVTDADGGIVPNWVSETFAVTSTTEAPSPKAKDAVKPAPAPVLYEAPVLPYLQPEDVTFDNLRIEYTHGWKVTMFAALNQAGIDSRNKRRRLLECKDKLGNTRLLFSPYMEESIERDCFPLIISKRKEIDDVIMMPDLSVQLLSASTGKEYGTLSYSLPPPPLADEKSLSETWTEVCQQDHLKLFDEANGLKILDATTAELRPIKDTDLDKVAPLRQGVCIDEYAYQVFIDIFAAEKGWLMWDDGFFMGRCLSSHRLFTIREDKKQQENTSKGDQDDDDDDNESDEEEEAADAAKAAEDAEHSMYPFSQYFNPADWMLGRQAANEEPYDERVRPILRCAEWNIAKWDEKVKELSKHPHPDELRRNGLKSPGWVSTRTFLDTSKGKDKAETLERDRTILIHQQPLSKEELWKAYFKYIKDDTAERAKHRKLANVANTAKYGTKVAERMLKGPEPIQEPWELVQMSTQMIFKRMTGVQWRCTSHLHAPEFVQNIDEPADVHEKDENFKPQAGLENNLHTFMRPLGHVIKTDDRDSRFLCRLRISMPEEEITRDIIVNALKGRANIHAQEEKMRFLYQSASSRFSKPRKRGAVREATEIDMAPTTTGGEPTNFINVSGAYEVVKRQDHCVNFLSIRFDRPGTIIWCNPAHVDSWDCPGKMMFAVKLSDYNSIVPVCVPNFDLRFQSETAWYPCKTLYERWMTLRNRIAKSGMAKKIEEENKKAKAAKHNKEREEMMKAAEDQANGEDADVEKGQGEAAEAEDADETNNEEERGSESRGPTKAHGGSHYSGPDGYSRPVFIHKHAFVCRIVKKKGGHNYDRPQTRNWFRTSLEDVFPEVKMIKKLDDDDADRKNVRDIFMGRFLNFRQPLVSGESQKESGMLKGNIIVKKVEKDAQGQYPPDENLALEALKRMKAERKLAAQRAEDKKREQEEANVAAGASVLSTLMSKISPFNVEDLSSAIHAVQDIANKAVGQDERPPPLFRPFDHMWLTCQCRIYVYVLTASGLTLPSGTTSVVPYLTAEIIGRDQKTSVKKSEMDAEKAKKMISFYDVFNMHASIPGDNSLQITIQSFNPLLRTSTELGKVTIDLEDRWLALGRRAMRSVCNPEYLYDNISQFDVEEKTIPAPFWVDLKDFDPEKSATKELEIANKQPGGSILQERVKRMKLDAQKNGGTAPAEEKILLKAGSRSPNLGEGGQAKYWINSQTVEPKEKKYRMPAAASKIASTLDSKIAEGKQQMPAAASKIASTLDSKIAEGKQQIDSGRKLMHMGSMGAGVGPLAAASMGDPSGEDKTGLVKVAPKISSADRLPVEIVDILKEDDETATEAKVGSLRFWMDINLETDDYKPAVLRPGAIAFEVRIIVKHARNIKIFKDIGERNDALIKGRLRVKDFTGKDQVHQVTTDTHKWATNEANWNWRWVFNVLAPASFCSLNLAIMDADTLSEYDPIYDPKDYPFDHIIMLAYRARRDGEPNLGTLKEQIIFDSWPKNPLDKIAAGCCCRCCQPKKELSSKKAAKLYLEICVLPQDEADLSPVEHNVCVAPPKGRLDWKTAVSQPVKFVHVLLGPTLERKCKVGGGLCACLLFAALLLACFFFLSQGLEPITVR